jgi:hypothetical protein
MTAARKSAALLNTYAMVTQTLLGRYESKQAGITRKIVCDRLEYCPDTGIFIWRRRTGATSGVALWNSRYAGTVAGTVNRAGYRLINISGKPTFAHRLAWLVVKGQWPEGELDHINNQRDDNRIANLRRASRSQNCANTTLYRNNSSGRRGVSREGNKWVARVRRNGKSFRLGLFETTEAAALAYEQASRAAHGEFSPTPTPSAGEAEPVFVINTTHCEYGPYYDVLVAGEYYTRLNKHLLAALRSGVSPEELELEIAEVAP